MRIYHVKNYKSEDKAFFDNEYKIIIRNIAIIFVEDSL